MEEQKQKLSKKRIKPEETKTVQRERVRECEQRRRDRIIDSFEILQNLLPTDKDSRVTKENILLGAVKFIQELRSEVESLKKQKQSALTRLEVDPLSTYPLTEEEIQAGFSATYIDTMNKLTSIENRSTMDTIENSTKYLGELAAKSKSSELTLHSNLMEIICSCVVNYHPRNLLSLLERTLPLQREIALTGKQIKWMGGDIEGLLYSMTAFATCSLGYYEKSTFYERKALECTKSHPNTAHLAYSTLQYLKHWRGEYMSIGEAAIIRDQMSKYEGFKPYASLTYAAAQLRSCHQMNEQMETIHVINNCVVESIGLMGTLLEYAVKTIAITCYMSIDPERALIEISNLIEKSEKSGVTGPFTKSEFLRIKGEILLLINGRTIDEHMYCQQEAERHLKAAASLAIDSQCDVSYLKAVMCLCKLYQSQGRTTDLVLELASLSRVYIKLSNQTKEPVGILVQAKHYVDLLSFIIKV